MTDEELKAKLAEYESQELKYAQDSIPLWVKIVLAAVLIVAMVAVGTAAYYYFQHDHAVVMTQEQIKSKEELAKQLNITQGQAKLLATELAKVQDKPPDIRYIVQAPTIEQAAVTVKRDIDAGKSPANAVPADKTVVTPNIKEQKVDVYRITLDKAKLGFNTLALAGGDLPFEVGAGISYTNKDWGADAGYTTRNRVYGMGSFYPKILN